MKTKSILLVISFFICASAYAQQGVLDGKQYKIVLMKDGVTDSKETLVFDKGMMDPLDCHQYGFTATEYQAKTSQGMSTFRVICKSEKEGTMAWSGKITGDKIEGNVSWTKDGQAPILYSFKGEAVATK